MKKLQNILSIVISRRSIEVSQVDRSGSRYDISNCATYKLSEGVNLDNLSADSVQFRAFLKTNGFKSRKAVIGIPAKNILSASIKVPPINDSQLLHETIKIHLERKVEVDISDLVFDYDESQHTSGKNILVLMALKKTVIQIREFLSDAGISPVQVTGTSLALGPADSSKTACNIIEFPEYYELCLYNNGTLSAVQYLPKNNSEPFSKQQAEKILRHVNRMCWSESIGGPVLYSLWTGRDISVQDKERFNDVFGNIEFRNITETSDKIQSHLAGRLGQCVLSGEMTCINFMNGRHVETKPTFINQQFRKIAAVAVIILVLIAAFIWDWRSDKKQIVYLKNKMDSIKDNVSSSGKMIDQVIYARQWFNQTPQYLEILRQLSLSFEENTDIWLTSLAVDESANQILTGRTANENSILDVVEKMRSGRYFDDIKILYIRKMGKGTNIMTFAINLRYRKEQ